jgi:hypothetical protein
MTLDPSRPLPSLAVVREWQRVTLSVISPPITGPIIISQLGVASTKRRIKTKGGDCEKQAANGRLRWNEARLSCAFCSMPDNDCSSHLRRRGEFKSRAKQVGFLCPSGTDLAILLTVWPEITGQESDLLLLRRRVWNGETEMHASLREYRYYSGNCEGS